MVGSKASVGRLARGKHVEHIEVHPHVHGTRTESHGDPSGAANLSADEPYALMSTYGSEGRGVGDITSLPDYPNTIIPAR
jgi:hypothetical protein